MLFGRRSHWAASFSVYHHKFPSKCRSSNCGQTKMEEWYVCRVRSHRVVAMLVVDSDRNCWCCIIPCISCREKHISISEINAIAKVLGAKKISKLRLLSVINIPDMSVQRWSLILMQHMHLIVFLFNCSSSLTLRQMTTASCLETVCGATRSILYESFLETSTVVLIVCGGCSVPPQLTDRLIRDYRFANGSELKLKYRST
jgi:hypothetical protein